MSALELESNGVGMLSGEAGIRPKLKQMHNVSLSHLIFCVETKRFYINECLNKSRHNVEWVSLGAVLYFDWPNQRSLGAMENLYRSVYKWEIFNSLFRKLRTLNLRTGRELNDLDEEFHKFLDRGKNELQ